MLRRLLLAAIALGVFGFGLDAASTVEAQAPTAGMSLGATSPANCNAQGCTVASGDAFSVTVSADPAPTFEISGFAAEVGLGGLVWQIRDCYTDLQIERANGQQAGVCVNDPGPDGEPRYVVISAVQQPPLPPLEDIGTGDMLVEIAVRCPAQGTYNVALYALSDAKPFGAFYAQTDTVPVPVQGQGTPPVADTLRVTCQGPGGIGSRSPVAIETNSATTPDPNETPGDPTDGATASGTPPATPTGGTVSAEDATATAVAAAAAGDGGDDDDGDSVWLWVIVGLAAAAAAAGLGFLAWRRYRADAGAGPPDSGSPPPAEGPPSASDSPP